MRGADSSVMARRSEFAIDALKTLAFPLRKIVFEFAAEPGERRFETLYRSGDVERGGAPLVSAQHVAPIDRAIESQDRFDFCLDAQPASRGLQPFHAGVEDPICRPRPARRAPRPRQSTP